MVMEKISVGAPIPDMEVSATDDQKFMLSDLRGKNVVLYFYPKDNTPGCTTEGQLLCKLFDVIKEKSLYGKKYLGIDRSTFILDRTGVLRKEYRSVKVDGHVTAVLAEIQKLAKE